MPDSFNVHSEWRGHYKRARLKVEAGQAFARVEIGLIWLWEWCTCRFGADRSGDGYLGDDLLRIAHEAEWPMDEGTAAEYLGYLEAAGLVEHAEDGWRLHDLLEWQPHLRKANSSRENGSKGGRPAKAATRAKKKPTGNPGEPKSTRTGQDMAGQDMAGQEDPPTPQGASPVPAISEVDLFAKGWRELSAKHQGLKGIQSNLTDNVRRKIAKALAHPDVAPYWRQALVILTEHGPSEWVVQTGLGWDWFLRTRAPDGGMGPAMAVVEAGKWVADRRPPGSRPGPTPQARETPVERQRRLVKQMRSGGAQGPALSVVRVVDGKAVAGE